jgi:hypothetical protein
MALATRTQAPEVDLFSMRARVVCNVPFWSSHDASTRTITADRCSSMTSPLIPSLSAGSQF